MLRVLIWHRAYFAFLIFVVLIGWFCNGHSSQPIEANPANAIERSDLSKGVSGSPSEILSSCSGTPVTVPTTDNRAVCQPGGTWNFTVTSVSGNVAKLYINVFTSSNPTDRNGDTFYDACLAANSSKIQIDCGGTSDSHVLTTLVLSKPLLGKTVTYTPPNLTPSYCLLFQAYGSANGSVGVCITQ